MWGTAQLRYLDGIIGVALGKSHESEAQSVAYAVKIGLPVTQNRNHEAAPPKPKPGPPDLDCVMQNPDG